MTTMDKDEFQNKLTELTAEAMDDLSAGTVLAVLATHVRFLIGMEMDVEDYDDGSDRFRVDGDLK